MIDSAQFVIRWDRFLADWKNDDWSLLIFHLTVSVSSWMLVQMQPTSSGERLRATRGHQDRPCDSKPKHPRGEVSEPINLTHDLTWWCSSCRVPSHLLFAFRYGALMGRRRPFVTSLRSYGDALLLMPAFSYGRNTPVSLRAAYTIEDFESPTRPIFFNPEYLQRLSAFWRAQGLKAVRLSTGIIMASLALELCNNVHLYGFWPFSNHPHGLHALTNHYYDNRQPKTEFHAMPAEFDLLLQLHTQGALRLHLGDCQPGEK